MIKYFLNTFNKTCLKCSYSGIDAAQGWVAVGFGDDRAMGRDAVLMATASTLTSRWNEGMPKKSVKTEDIGFKNATVQGHMSEV